VKRFLCVFLLLATNVFASTVNIVTTSGPGSLSDQVARYIQPLLAKELGVEVVVVNAPGGNGVVGLRAFNQLNGDHLLIGSFAVPYVAKVSPQKDFDPVKDFTPIAGLVYPPMHVIVPVNSPAKTLTEFIELARKNGELKGGASHPSTNISMTLFDKAAGVTTQQVNYKQGVQLYTDLAAGLLDYTFGGSVAVSGALIQGGRLKSLGRLDQLGVPDFSWIALFVKTGSESSKVSQAAKKVSSAEYMAGLPQPFFKTDAAALRNQILREHNLIPAQ
jgi:tripartite-type tricarboxylate transporter receptor subunit TctC